MITVPPEPARLPKLLAVPKMPERTQSIRNGSTIKPMLDMFICVFHFQSSGRLPELDLVAVCRICSLSGRPSSILSRGTAVAHAVIVFSFLALHRIANQAPVEDALNRGVYIFTHIRLHGSYGAHDLSRLCPGLSENCARAYLLTVKTRRQCSIATKRGRLAMPWAWRRNPVSH